MRGGGGYTILHDCSSHKRRVIPAHAGNIIPLLRYQHRPCGHPRPCGEYTNKMLNLRHFRQMITKKNINFADCKISMLHLRVYLFFADNTFWRMEKGVRHIAYSLVVFVMLHLFSFVWTVLSQLSFVRLHDRPDHRAYPSVCILPPGTGYLYNPAPSYRKQYTGR